MRVIAKCLGRFCSLFGILLGCFLFVYIVFELDGYGRQKWLPSRSTIQLLIFSLVTFYAVVAQFRRRWARPTFWITLSGLLFVHLVGYSLFLKAQPQWPLLAFALVAVVEIQILCSILQRIQ